MIWVYQRDDGVVGVFARHEDDNLSAAWTHSTILGAQSSIKAFTILDSPDTNNWYKGVKKTKYRVSVFETAAWILVYVAVRNVILAFKLIIPFLSLFRGKDKSMKALEHEVWNNEFANDF